MKKLILLISLVFLTITAVSAQHHENHQHNGHLETLLSEYLDMKEALVNDNFEVAKSSLQNFAEEVTSSNEMNHHPEHADMHQAHHNAMITAVESASNAENIDQFRNSFDEISAELIKALKNQGYEGDLHVQFCPMADNGNANGNGARWLSEKKKLKIHITER